MSEDEDEREEARATGLRTYDDSAGVCRLTEGNHPADSYLDDTKLRVPGEVECDTEGCSARTPVTLITSTIGSMLTSYSQVSFILEGIPEQWELVSRGGRYPWCYKLHCPDCVAKQRPSE